MKGGDTWKQGSLWSFSLLTTLGNVYTTLPFAIDNPIIAQRSCVLACLLK